MEIVAPTLAACEYKTGNTLGSGSYGVVKEAVRIATGEKFAIKLISKKLMRGRESLVINEINVLKKVSKGHKNIVTLHDYFESPNNLYLVMDLCTGGELFDRILFVGHFYELDAIKIISTVCNAIEYLHSQNIVHRDVKPENLIFRTKDIESDLMIADFGLSKITEDEENSLKTYVGTPGYMAPEILQRTGHAKPVDIWAVGVMTFFLLCGYLPFESSSNAQELDNILNARYSIDGDYWGDISKEVVDPAKRMTATQCLKHPWLNQTTEQSTNKDLLPHVREGFDARKMFKKAVDVVKAVHKLCHPSASKQRLDKLADGSELNNSNDSLVFKHDTNE